MKYIKTVLLLLFAQLFFYNCWAQNLTDGLIAFYPFDKNPSNYLDKEIVDKSKHRNTGTYIGNIGYVQDRHGVDCRAISFARNSYITIPNSSSLSSPTTQFTAAVWVKIANGADFFKQWLTILCKSDNTQESANSPHYRVQATAQTVSINTDFTESFIPQLSYDTWYFYAYVFDGNKVKVYLDGQFVFEDDYRGKLYSNTMPLEIGRDLPGAIEYFNGAMDDLRIYNRALNESELSQLYRDDSGIGQQSACSDNQPAVVANPPNQDNDNGVITIPLDDPIYDGVIEEDEKVQEEEEILATEAPIIPVITDSVSTPKTYEDLPEVVGDIPVEYQKTIIVKGKNIKIYPYDNEKEDGDIVSININGNWVRKRFKIKNKKPKPYRKDYISVTLNDGGNNYIVSKAINEGTQSPNTLTLEIDDGTSKQEIIINSLMGVSGGIRIVSSDE